MSSKRTLEERIREKDAQWQKAAEKANQYAAQKKRLERMKKAEDRKTRSHRLIEIGACAESVLGRSFTDGDNIRFLNFLKQQEKNGGFFTKAMNRPLPKDSTSAEAEVSSGNAQETAGAEMTGDTAGNLYFLFETPDNQKCVHSILTGPIVFLVFRPFPLDNIR